MNKSNMTHNNNDPQKSQLDFIALIAIQYSTRVDVLETEVSELRNRLGQIELCLYDRLSD